MSKFKHFERQHVKFPADIDSFTAILANLIRDQADRCLEITIDETLDQKAYSSDQDSDLPSTSARCENQNESSGSDSDYEPEEERMARQNLIAQHGEAKLVKVYQDALEHGPRWTEKYHKLSQDKVKSILRSAKNTSNRMQKMKELKEMLIVKFDQARETGLSVRYWNIEEWAFDLAKMLNLDRFKCSKSFVTKFKEEYRIVSRHVTKFTTKAKLKNQDKLLEDSRKFVAEINELLPDYKSNRVFNTDQTRIDFEPTSASTLNRKGAKEIVSLVKSL